MKSSIMVCAAAKLTITPLVASVDSATGMKSMIKVLVFAVYLVVATTSSISVSKSVSAYPTFGKWLMVPVRLVSFTLPTTRSPNLAFATKDS